MQSSRVGGRSVDVRSWSSPSMLCVGMVLPGPDVESFAAEDDDDFSPPAASPPFLSPPPPPLPPPPPPSKVTAATFSPPTQALTPTISQSLNLVFLRTLLTRPSTSLNLSSRIPASSSFPNRSILFRTTIISRHVISAMTMHSAVWVWMPLLASMTRRTMSIIWAPPMMVRIREAWPGQSTRVIWRASYLHLLFTFALSASTSSPSLPSSYCLPSSTSSSASTTSMYRSSEAIRSGTGAIRKALNPKSNVIPRCRL
mmetsp:Transcript_38449/g.83529  ORF Transcript_38449/g.83529 Transcript_38449/m.83529 type:complete len:256 (+) Transcript_38449:1815-2582(+)